MIEIVGLSFRFRGRDEYALRGVDLAVAPGEFLVISGPSGCGKSTLALAIGGYLFRQYDGQAEGSVRVGGMDVQQQPIYDVAEVVGLVQQNPEAQFCTLTVQDEVAFGLENRRLPRAEIRERMAWALDVVAAGHLVDRTLATLSGGEKQKVAIAAMMAARPQVLILDEPTSNLDPSATVEILAVIEEIQARAGITVLVIEHKIDYLRRLAGRMVAMEEGRIVYDGPMPDAPRPVLAPWVANPGPQVGAPLVRVSNLHAGYPDRPVLRGLSLEIGAGEFVAVMGDNGSGKTTLLRCLLGLMAPTSGCVEVLGHDTRRTPVSRLARQVGFVFQNPDHQLFADSVWQEATLALDNFAGGRGAVAVDADKERAAELLDLCGLAVRRDDHPYKLSYGQKRRLNLVSILCYDPRVVLLDEVLIGQDPANVAFLLGLLREQVAQGAAVIMVNHAPDVTRQVASRLLFLRDGEVLVDAPTEEGFARLAALDQAAYVPAGGS